MDTASYLVHYPHISPSEDSTLADMRLQEGSGGEGGPGPTRQLASLCRAYGHPYLKCSRAGCSVTVAMLLQEREGSWASQGVGLSAWVSSPSHLGRGITEGVPGEGHK